MTKLSRLGALITFAVLAALPLLLAGCGGGGSSGAQAANQQTVAATSGGDSSGGATFNPTGSTTSGGSSSGTTTSGGSSSSSSSSGGPTPPGPGTFAGQISDELGVGLSGVALRAQPVMTTASRSAEVREISGSTDASGNFAITGFNTDQPYALTISRQDRKTLRTVFTVDPNSPDVTMLLVAPQGIGQVEFNMPRVLHLSVYTTQSNPSSTIARKNNLSWEASTNPGFLAYLLYGSPTPNQGLQATQKFLTLAPTTHTFVESNDAFTPTYYRVYEKLLIPELGTFLMLGTNEVVTVFTKKLAYTPAYDAVNVPADTTIQQEFSGPMDQASVQAGLVVSNFTTGAVFAGTQSWNGNTVTFTPSQPFAPGVRVRVTLTNAKDAYGNFLSTPIAVTAFYVAP